MRKVRPEDEIPVTLTYEERAAKAEYKLSPALVKKVSAIEKFVLRASQREQALDVDTLISRIYKVTDEIISTYYKDVSVCRKGCAHCCKVPVQVSAVEASYLGKHIGIEMHDLTKSDRGVNLSERSYCPLLDQETGLCSAYEYRPLACRTFMTVDSHTMCEDPSNEHYIVSMGSIGAAEFLSTLMIKISELSPYAAYADIRDWVNGKNNR